MNEANFTLADQRAQLELDLAQAQAGCDSVAVAGLYYLHADHLGRPQFATDNTGAVVWDMGEGVTPFGDSVNLAGAFAQRLMFPGQYADVETGDDTTTLSHNWHRTYDPTLGRYLQSDPIGLAGGLNRYAYVGGNPVGAVDPMGLYFYYNQATGELSHSGTGTGSCDFECKETPIATGYSGATGYINDTASERLESKGPIPRGTYIIGPPQDRSWTYIGPNLPLTPIPSNKMFDRKAFLIHGDSITAPGTASAGCIIFNKGPRKTIWDLAQKHSDYILVVR